MTRDSPRADGTAARTRAGTAASGPPAAAVSAAEGGIRYITPAPPEIVPATDLGSVVTIKHGNLFLLSDAFGDIHPDSRGLGLYAGDTRVLSVCAVRINGLRPSLLQASAGGNFRGSIQMTNPDEPASTPGPGDAATAAGDQAGADELGVSLALPQRSLGIQRDRILGGALLERLSIANYTAHEQTVVVSLALGADAADIFEVRGFQRAQRGELLPIAVRGEHATLRYVGLDGVERMTHVEFADGVDVGPAVLADGGVGRGGGPAGGGLGGARASIVGRWRLTIAPGDRRAVDWRVWSSERPVGTQRGASSGNGQQADAATQPGVAARFGVAAHPTKVADVAALFPEPPSVTADQGAAAYRAWVSSTTAVDTDNQLFTASIQRSLADLRLLLNDGPGPGERYVSAGVPWFATLFGRDAIITALQLLPFRPQIAVETLGVLAARQATAVDDGRDAEPGKILHELRDGEMARAGEVPFSPYYGTIDATPLWLMLLGATYEWTGDRGLVDRFWPNAMAALDWIDRWGDRDGDGFVEYQRRTDRGFYNMGWKDSVDGIRDRNGRIATLPIALAEVQGYVYDAKLRLAGLARLRGEAALADRLDADAAVLRARFNEAFWVADESYYAMALDGDKRPVDAIASNPGHCLWTGICSPERARHVADQLLGPGLFSGWGVRTYASGQPGYHPIGYHTGTVWPHDTSIAAAGLKRYGFNEEANHLVTAMFEAAQHFPDGRLPELFCGFDRELGDHGSRSPVPYPVACSPQAWAAGSTFQFLGTMLGLRAHADRRELELSRPHLPPFLTRATVTNLRVGDASVDLLFHRWRGTTSAEVLRKVGDISVTIRL